VIGPRDLGGLWGFALTPFRGPGVDEAAYRSGVRAMVDGGADVVVACGTLGQGDRMTGDERTACLGLARAETAGRVPVLGVLIAGDDTERGAASLAEAGADAALLLPTTGDPGDAARAIASVGRATGGRLPLVLYQRGPLRLEPAELRELAAAPGLVGLKDAHGDLRRFRRLREAVGDRLAWIGASEDLGAAYRTHGADAVSPASLACAPAYARRWWGALDAGDVAEAIRLLRLFAWPVTDLRTSRPAIDISVVRELARILGRPVGELRLPAGPLTAAELHEVGRLADVLRTELGAVG
jgi:5-dehydro-4-deoxyglucarate dehydratase